MSGNADLEYLFSDSIGKIIAEGLTVLYEKQPQFPVDFLGKWLLNYCAEQENKEQELKAAKVREELYEKLQQRLQEVEKAEKRKEYELERIQKIETLFRERIKNHLYHDELLDSELPNFIQQVKKFPAVYIGLLGHPSKNLAEDDDDPYGHIEAEKQKLITYVGASDNQRFMIGKQLQPETGVTYAIFQPVEEDPDRNPDEPYEEEKPRTLYVPDVTQEKEMVFFTIPKLGAYLAVSLSYKSVLNENAFDEGLKERLRYKELKEAQNQEKEAAEAEYRAKLEEAEEEGRDTAEIEAEWNAREWEHIEEKEFEATVKDYILCIDTMGEDREITQEEKNWVKELALYFVECWEQSEKAQLSRDIDLQIESIKDFNREEFLDYINLRVDEEVGERMNTDALEEETELRTNCRRAAHTAEVYRGILLEEQHQNKITYLRDYRVIKHWGVIQEALITIGYTKEEINYPHTNVLDWKKAKHLLNEEKFFSKIAEYNFKGPRTVKPPKYACTNRILRRLEKFNVEEIDNYNVGLGVLYRFLKHVLEARLLDIQLRKEEKAIARQRREQLIEEEQNRIAQREKDLAEAREAFAAEHEHENTEEEEEEEEPQEFNEEEFLRAWDEEHPVIEIPEEVVDDIDADIDEDAPVE